MLPCETLPRVRIKGNPKTAVYQGRGVGLLEDGAHQGGRITSQRPAAQDETVRTEQAPLTPLAWTRTTAIRR